MEALRKLECKCDHLDYDAIMRAVALKQKTNRVNGQSVLPDFQGSLLGCLLAEICRDWEEYREMWPRRVDGDEWKERSDA